ncbi:MAG: hypothetical protein HY909_00535 [Deltaproteobacteria bacterium]|nr:hypothetical protein [Deltaproteobacteria bacterium]
MRPQTPTLRGLCLTLLVPALALAQPRPTDPSVTHLEGMIRVRQAQAAQRRGDFVEAARLLREAADLGAPPLVYRELARTCERMNRFREAAAAWTRYAALAEDLEERNRALARRELLRRHTGPVYVHVSPPAAGRGARVWVDRDFPRIYTAGGVEVITVGGEHRVRVEAPGWQAWETRVVTAFGEPAEVRATLRIARR